jgi:hypothetical protein
LKINYIGIVGGIIAFISLALPWWTMSFSMSSMSMSLQVYPFQATTEGVTATLNLWYGWVALTFVVIGGLLGIIGSLIEKGKLPLLGGGILALLSIIVFAAGLQMDISGALSGFTSIGLFSSGSYLGASYSTYLSYGFWLALVSAIIMLVAAMRTTPKTAPKTVPTS